MNGLNTEDQKHIEEALSEEPLLPEAPLSIHIDCYLKGFHVGITIRDHQNETVPIQKIISTVTSLIKLGFQPSWNIQTNEGWIPPSSPTSSPTSSPDSPDSNVPTSSNVPIPNPSSQPRAEICPIHNKIMALGKWGWYCKTKLPNGTWCNYSPAALLPNQLSQSS